MTAHVVQWKRVEGVKINNKPLQIDHIDQSASRT